MKNIEQWKETKFIFRKGKLRANTNTHFVSLSSRLVADTVANHYQQHALTHFKGKLLDLGCGFVPFYSFYKDQISELTCADWGNSMHQNSFLDVQCDLNEKLPFENDSFDSILLSDVLEHIRKPEELLKEIQRILTNDGVLIMNVPYFYCLHEEPYDYFRYTEFALKSMVADAGLNTKVFHQVGGSMEIMTDLFAKNIRSIPLIGNMGAVISQKVTWQLLKIPFIRKINKKTSVKFPLGYFLVAQKKS
ncbi:MAG: class I SAM-dependent methyltransferase [Flavobacteriales bacterium]